MEIMIGIIIGALLPEAVRVVWMVINHVTSKNKRTHVVGQNPNKHGERSEPLGFRKPHD